MINNERPKNIKLTPHPYKRLIKDKDAAKGRYPISDSKEQGQDN